MFYLPSNIKKKYSSDSYRNQFPTPYQEVQNNNQHGFSFLKNTFSQTNLISFYETVTRMVDRVN